MKVYLIDHQRFDTASWEDHPRDLLHIINYFRNEMPRPIVGIGHSMGASALCVLLSLHPAPFDKD